MWVSEREPRWPYGRQIVNSFVCWIFTFLTQEQKPNSPGEDGEDIENGKLWWKGFKTGKQYKGTEEGEKMVSLSQPVPYSRHISHPLTELF